MNAKKDIFELKTLKGTEQELIKHFYDQYKGCERAIKMLAQTMEESRIQLWQAVRAYYPLEKGKYSLMYLSDDGKYTLSALLKEPDHLEQRELEKLRIRRSRLDLLNVVSKMVVDVI